MTEAQKKFFELLDQYPRFKHHWDKEKRTCDLESFDQDFKVMSSGERHMARFFISVWLNESETYPFNVLDAIRVIDDKSRKLVIVWLANPFFP
ncbi:hypothetical protein [Endozoicomonas sp. ONNA1]|uniref:hypothetical protein n=1 Tax=Endozoicomonas sp. ONNA1 TaxID=2828740 RepID=UPI0021477FE0|nr:hypothetical protein [Endozoicomonas sp. ONNA1]